MYRTGHWSIFTNKRFPSSRIFNALLRIHHFHQTWKHAREISILKQRKDPALPSSHRPISLLDTIGKLFEKILIAKTLHVVNQHGQLRDEHYGFRPRQYVLVADPPRWKNSQEFRQKEAQRRSHPRRGQSLRCRLDRWSPLQANTPQHPVYIVNKSHPTSEVGHSKRPSRRPHHLVDAWGLGVAHGGLILIYPATLRGTNRMGRHYSLSGVTLDTRPTLLPHIGNARFRTDQRMGMLCSLLNRKSNLSFRNWVLLYKQPIRTLIYYARPVWRPDAHYHVWKIVVVKSKYLSLAPAALGT